MKWENIRRKYYTSSRVSITFTTLHLWHNDGHQNERSQHLCVIESIRIQVQFYVRYFTNYFLTSLENCLVYIFLSIVTSVDALNICAARHMWPLIKIIKHKQESANLKKGLRKKGAQSTLVTYLGSPIPAEVCSKARLKNDSNLLSSFKRK